MGNPHQVVNWYWLKNCTLVNQSIKQAIKQAIKQSNCIASWCRKMHTQCNTQELQNCNNEYWEQTMLNYLLLLYIQSLLYLRTLARLSVTCSLVDRHNYRNRSYLYTYGSIYCSRQRIHRHLKWREQERPLGQRKTPPSWISPFCDV